jgi:hypothetical protein
MLSPGFGSRSFGCASEWTSQSIYSEAFLFPAVFSYRVSLKNHHHTQKMLLRLWATCTPSFFLRSFCELPGFVFDEYLSSMAARAWGCLTAQAGLRLCARLFSRAYLALHPHARLCFFGAFVVIGRFSVVIGKFLCLPLTRV